MPLMIEVCTIEKSHRAPASNLEINNPSEKILGCPLIIPIFPQRLPMTQANVLKNTNTSIDTSIQIHNDINRRNQDLCRDKHNDCSNPIKRQHIINPTTSILPKTKKKKGCGGKERRSIIPIHSKYSPCFVPT